MRVFRLSKEKYKEDLTGKGAERYGGRWNSKGTRMLYTADSRALAKLEIAVHVPLNRLPNNYVMITIDIPDTLIDKYDPLSLEDKQWKHNPPIKFTQLEGDAFIKNNKALALLVPSAVVEGDFSILINPEHADANRLKIIDTKKFDFDMRLFKRSR